MFDRSKPKIGCSSSIINKWTCLSSFDVRKMMFEFDRCSIKWCSTHHYISSMPKLIYSHFSVLTCYNQYVSRNYVLLFVQLIDWNQLLSLLEMIQQEFSPCQRAIQDPLWKKQDSLMINDNHPIKKGKIKIRNTHSNKFIIKQAWKHKNWVFSWKAYWKIQFLHISISLCILTTVRITIF